MRRQAAQAHPRLRPRRRPLRASDAYRRLLADDAPAYADLSAGEQRLARMLFFSLWADGGGHSSYDDGLAALRSERAARDELDARRRPVVRRGTPPDACTWQVALPSVPLRVHARYQREEILAALDYASLERKPTSMMQGVAYSEALNVDAFFVTLKKSEADYSPTTMYRDYPISPTLFHWESQSTPPSPHQPGSATSTARARCCSSFGIEQKDEFGTSPYLFLGPALTSHEGERPIAITWQLDTRCRRTSSPRQLSLLGERFRNGRIAGLAHALR